MYYTKNEKGDKCQILKKSEFLVAQVLLSEGRSSAVPVGWSQAAPIGTSYLDINPAMPVQAAAPQPLVYDMPSAPPARVLSALCIFVADVRRSATYKQSFCRSDEAVQAARAYFDQPLSYRNMTEAGEYAMQKQVLEDSVLIGERFASSKDALTALMELKQNIGGLR